MTAQDITIYLDASGSATITAADVVTSASDNCSVSDTTLSKTAFDCSNTGDNTVTVTVTDPSGNSTSEEVTVTVLDTIKPNLTVQDITIYLACFRKCYHYGS